MKKINALNNSDDFKLKTLQFIQDHPEQSSRYAAHAYAAGHTLKQAKKPAFEPRVGELAEIQTKAVWADRVAVTTQNLWHIGLIPTTSLGAWLILRATELSQTLNTALISPLGFTFAGATAGVASLCAVSLLSSKWAHDKLGLEERTLDISVESLNKLIREATPALALLNSLEDPFAKPAFGHIVAGIRQNRAGEIMTDIRLSDVKKLETYESREWAPQRSGLINGDVICHFNNGERAASMIMGPEGMGRLAIDLHFAIKRATELGYDPDPIGTQLQERIYRRLQEKMPWERTKTSSEPQKLSQQRAKSIKN